MAQPTYDFETESEAIKRKQAVLDALSAGSLAPLQPTSVGGVAAPTHWSNALAKVLQAYVGSKGQEALQQQRGDLAKRYGDTLRSGMEQFQQTSQGQQTPAQFGPLPSGGTMDIPATNIPGDRKKAIYDAIASTHPVLREFGMGQLKKEGEGGLLPKDLVSLADPASVLAARDNPAAWKPKREIKEAGGIPFNASTGEILRLTGGAPEQVVIKGDLYERNPSTGSLRKLDNAPKVNVTTSNTVLNKAQSELAVGRSKAANEDLAAAEKANALARKSLGTAAKMESLQDTYTGPAAPAAVWLGQLANSAGIPVNHKRLADSETFESESAQMWISLMEQAGGSRGLVKEESERIARAVPALSHTPQGRKQLLGMVKARAMETQQLVQAKQKAMANAAKADNPNLYFEAINELGNANFDPVVPKSSAKPSVSNW